MAFTARYPGRCASTGLQINVGDRIQSIGRGRYALVDPIASDSDLSMAQSIDPELAQADPDAAASAGRYMRASLARSVSHYARTSTGAELYRNRSGRCEDAPCCGCCNY